MDEVWSGFIHGWSPIALQVIQLLIVLFRMLIFDEENVVIANDEIESGVDNECT